MVTIWGASKEGVRFVVLEGLLGSPLAGELLGLGLGMPMGGEVIVRWERAEGAAGKGRDNAGGDESGCGGPCVRFNGSEWRDAEV